MLSDFLERIEEKFVFKTSRLFFHIFVGLAALSLTGSVLLFLWGITPSLKPSVDKEPYPEAEQVTVEELQSVVNPIREKKKLATAAQPDKQAPAKPVTQKAKETAVETVDPLEAGYNKSVEKLKQLIPPEKYSWKDKASWTKGWYRDGRGRSQYGNHRTVHSYGLESRLKWVFKNVNADNFNQKKTIVDTYLPLLSRMEEEKRPGTLKALFNWSVENSSTTIDNMRLVQAALDSFKVSDKDADIVERLTTFGKKNPRDGSSFVNFVNNIIPRFDKENRVEALDALIQSYYRFYDDITVQKEVTEYFLPMLSSIEGKYQAKAIPAFYEMYIQKNSDRRQAIRRIENRYESELSQAEFELREKQAAKAENRYQGLIGIGGSIVLVAVVALILVLLSMQRNIKDIKFLAVQSQNGANAIKEKKDDLQSETVS